MKPTDRDAEADGGFSFEAQESQVEVTRGERMRTFWEEFVYKPGLVAWDDVRTRLGLILMGLYLLLATVGVYFYPEPSKNQVDIVRPETGFPEALRPFEARPEAGIGTFDAPLGTTPDGTDVMAQAIHATPNMLLMVASGAFFATAIAVFVGTLAGYKGGRVDSVITTFSDIAMAIPGLPIVMVVAFIYEPTSPLVIGPIIMINYWAGLGRSLRSQVLTLREEPYVEASRTMGVGSLKILYKDILPNLMPYILVNFAFAARYVVFASVGLYYLGVLPTSLANWGFQLDRAYNSYSAMVGTGAFYLILIPMIFIGVLALALVLLAQGMDRVFNPRVRTRMAGESTSEEIDEDEDIVTRGAV